MVNTLARYECTSAKHIPHEDGILNGIRADCPRCKGYKLGELDDTNMREIIGATKYELQQALGSPGFRYGFLQAIGQLPVMAILVEGDRLHDILSGDAKEKD